INKSYSCIQPNPNSYNPLPTINPLPTPVLHANGHPTHLTTYLHQQRRQCLATHGLTATSSQQLSKKLANTESPTPTNHPSDAGHAATTSTVRSTSQSSNRKMKTLRLLKVIGRSNTVLEGPNESKKMPGMSFSLVLSFFSLVLSIFSLVLSFFFSLCLVFTHLIFFYLFRKHSAVTNAEMDALEDQTHLR